MSEKKPAPKRPNDANNREQAGTWRRQLVQPRLVLDRAGDPACNRFTLFIHHGSATPPIW
ncbi:MAG: hypothetical protein IPM07_27310 [Anaerolineales bacterium]|nr:hypothetical protein [Anaerolineales bacterium]